MKCGLYSRFAASPLQCEGINAARQHIGWVTVAHSASDRHGTSHFAMACRLALLLGVLAAVAACRASCYVRVNQWGYTPGAPMTAVRKMSRIISVKCSLADSAFRR